MITPQQVNAKFGWVEPYLAPLQKQIRETLSPYCEAHAFALTSRIKRLDSLCEKIESGRYPTWSEIDDLVAFAIVVPTIAEEDAVIEFLTAQFHRIGLKRRGSSRKAPDVFRFDSTRFIGRLRPPPENSKGREVDEISFEVQIRSAFDHAWIVTTHALTYKSPVIDWKQQRLAAELKATTEKLDMLIVAFQEASIKIPESPWPAIQTKKDIHRFFVSASGRGDFPRELLPKDWSRFIDNVYDLGRHCAPGVAPDDIASAIEDAVMSELSSLGSEKVPRSLSLWQITLASLSKAGVLKVPENRYWPLITPELEALYPALKDFQPRFDLGMSGE